MDIFQVISLKNLDFENYFKLKKSVKIYKSYLMDAIKQAQQIAEKYANSSSSKKFFSIEDYKVQKFKLKNYNKLYQRMKHIHKKS